MDTHFNAYEQEARGFRYAMIIWRAHGMRGVMQKIIHASQLQLTKIASQLFPRSKSFTFNGTPLIYTRADYNRTTWNERSVEISIIEYYLKKNHVQSHVLLEVGAVLQHYRESVDWVVVDKFEKIPGVINEDIETFRPSKKFPFIISISTLEHIGKDDDADDPEKIARIVTHLKKECLGIRGNMVATVPLGYNKFLDSMIQNNAFECSSIYFLRRISWSNEWTEVQNPSIAKIKYCWPYNNANMIAIMEWGVF